MNFIKYNSYKSLIITIFFIFLISGLMTFKDYGISIDEKFHRLNGFYWLNYILSFTEFTNIKNLVSEKIPEISDFTLADVEKFNIYGIIYDLPAAYFEILFNFQETKNVYEFRHLLNFIFFFTSSIFFYKILKSRFDKFSSLIGLLLYILSPRIYGESFYNSKDIIFLSLLTIAIYFCFNFFKNKKIADLIFFSFFSAACIQTRIIGVFLPFSFLVFFIFTLIANKNQISLLPKVLLYFIFSSIFLYVFWPYLWESPINNFFSIFLNLENLAPDIQILFDGNYIDVNYMPFSYLPVWIFISTPLFNSLMFVIGSFIIFFRFTNRLITFESLKLNHCDFWRGENEKKDLFIFFNFYVISLILITFNITLLNSWRYVFFLNIFMIYIATFSIYLLKMKIKKKLSVLFFKVALSISVLLNIYNLIIYHPFQGLFFNAFLSSEYKNNFEVDHGAISGKSALNWILENDRAKEINIAVASWSPLYRNIDAMKDENKGKINIIGQNYNDASYIYTNNISEVDKSKDKKYDIPSVFTKVYDLNINNLIIYEIYKKK